MVNNKSANQSIISINLSEKYKDAWSNFSDKKTIKCVRKNIDYFKNLSNHIKIMGQRIPLREYRVRLQRLLTFLMKKGSLTNAIPCLKEKLAELAKRKGLAKTLLHLTEAVIGLLGMAEEVFAEKRVDEKGELLVF